MVQESLGFLLSPVLHGEILDVNIARHHRFAQYKVTLLVDLQADNTSAWESAPTTIADVLRVQNDDVGMPVIRPTERGGQYGA